MQLMRILTLYCFASDLIRSVVFRSVEQDLVIVHEVIIIIIIAKVTFRLTRTLLVANMLTTKYIRLKFVTARQSTLNDFYSPSHFSTNIEDFLKFGELFVNQVDQLRMPNKK